MTERFPSIDWVLWGSGDAAIVEFKPGHSPIRIETLKDRRIKTVYKTFEGPPVPDMSDVLESLRLIRDMTPLEKLALELQNAENNA